MCTDARPNSSVISPLKLNSNPDVVEILSIKLDTSGFITSVLIFCSESHETISDRAHIKTVRDKNVLFNNLFFIKTDLIKGYWSFFTDLKFVNHNFKRIKFSNKIAK
jgi:hypothetical protein